MRSIQRVRLPHSHIDPDWPPTGTRCLGMDQLDKAMIAGHPLSAISTESTCVDRFEGTLDTEQPGSL